MTIVRTLVPSILMVIVLVFLATWFARTRAQVAIPRPEDVRFQLLVNEPIAAPDGRSVVPASSALVLRDRRTSQCYIVVSVGSTMAMAPAACGL